MSAAALRAQADRRIDAAVNEALDQMANGWTPAEVAAVMEDACKIIGDLLNQADAAALEELQLHHLEHGHIVDDISARAEVAS